MSSAAIRLPAPPFGYKSVIVTEWLVAPGDRVEFGETVVRARLGRKAVLDREVASMGPVRRWFSRLNGRTGSAEVVRRRAPEVVIQASEDGVMAAISAPEGAHVDVGQPLATVDTGDDGASTPGVPVADLPDFRGVLEFASNAGDTEEPGVDI